MIKLHASKGELIVGAPLVVEPSAVLVGEVVRCRYNRRARDVKLVGHIGNELLDLLAR